MQYEFRVLIEPAEQDLELLMDEHGAEGFEMKQAVVTSGGRLIIFFQRELDEFDITDAGLDALNDVSAGETALED